MFDLPGYIKLFAFSPRVALQTKQFRISLLAWRRRFSFKNPSGGIEYSVVGDTARAVGVKRQVFQSRAPPRLAPAAQHKRASYISSASSSSIR